MMHIFEKRVVKRAKPTTTEPSAEFQSYKFKLETVRKNFAVADKRTDEAKAKWLKHVMDQRKFSDALAESNPHCELYDKQVLVLLVVYFAAWIVSVGAKESEKPLQERFSRTLLRHFRRGAARPAGRCSDLAFQLPIPSWNRQLKRKITGDARRCRPVLIVENEKVRSSRGRPRAHRQGSRPARLCNTDTASSKPLKLLALEVSSKRCRRGSTSPRTRSGRRRKSPPIPGSRRGSLGGLDRHDEAVPHSPRVFVARTDSRSSPAAPPPPTSSG